MVQTEAADKVAPNLYQASKQWILNSWIFSAALQASDEQQIDVTNDKQDSKQISDPAPATSTEYLVYNWLEALFAWFQVIILWHQPIVSLCVLSGLLSSFLLLTYFAPRFYATIMIALFIYNANKFWFKHVWPAIRVPPEQAREEEMILDVDRWTYLHPQLMTLTELGEHTRNLKNIGQHFLRLALELRRNNHTKFCLLVTSILSITAYIGNRISGINLIFFCLITLFTSPGIYQYLLPNSFKHWIEQLSYLKILKNVQSEEHIAKKSNPSTIESPTLSEADSIEQITEERLVSLVSKVEQQALTLLEHFRKRSIGRKDSNKELPLPPLAASSSSSSSSSSSPPTTTETMKFEATSRINVPTTTEQSQSNQDNGERREHSPNEETNDLRLQQEVKIGSDLMSSNDSVSLIESDDDQQDGFVLL